MKIRKAEDLTDIRSVWRLTYEAYLAMGYTGTLRHRLLAHYPHLDVMPETTIFMAEDDEGRLLGTVSHTDDGPAGLPVDDDFKDVVDRVRAECAREGLGLGAPWRMASDPRHRGSLSVGMALVAEMVEFLKRNRVEVSLYTLNPRHVSVYRKILNLEVIAERVSKAVRNAPAVLMRGDLAKMTSAWERVEKRRASVRRQAVLV